MTWPLRHQVDVDAPAEKVYDALLDHAIRPARPVRDGQRVHEGDWYVWRTPSGLVASGVVRRVRPNLQLVLAQLNDEQQEGLVEISVVPTGPSATSLRVTHHQPEAEEPLKMSTTTELYPRWTTSGSPRCEWCGREGQEVTLLLGLDPESPEDYYVVHPFLCDVCGPLLSLTTPEKAKDTTPEERAGASMERVLELLHERWLREGKPLPEWLLAAKGDLALSAHDFLPSEGFALAPGAEARDEPRPPS